MSAAIYLTIAIATIFYFYIKYKYNYWKKRGVGYVEPTFPFGNAPYTLSKGVSYGLDVLKYYDELKRKGCRVGGVYFGLKPVLVVVDPNYACDILCKDFSYFTDRAFYYNKKYPITVNISSKRGEDWRVIRKRCSHLFTNNRIKSIFNTVKEYSKNVETHLEEHFANNKYLNLVDSMASFNINILGFLLFGEEFNIFKDEENPFKVVGNAIFDASSILHRINMHIANYFPDLAVLLGVTNMSGEVLVFFKKFLKAAMDFRKQNNIVRKDLVQMLMELKKESNISEDELAAQIITIFGGGFETSASELSFMLFELAHQQDAQKKVRKEIKYFNEKYNNDIPYEALQEMTLLNQACNETLRRYTVAGVSSRICVQDYTFKESNVTVSKDTIVLIPTFSYQTDPDYFPDPLTWKLDRFKDKTQKHVGFLPFGDGPRNCIGKMLGVMQMQIGAITILKNYRLTPNPKIKVPIKFDTAYFLTRPTETLSVKLHKE
nr:cytochrome P450 [Agasicles hygrophila]